MGTDTITERTEHAKKLHAHIHKILHVEGESQDDNIMHKILFYGGMIAETLFEYEEPDVVMEQTFYRIADLLGAEPEQIELDELTKVMPDMAEVDHVTEKGRALARDAAGQLDDGLSDVHEIIIGLIISDFPDWDEDEDIDITAPRCLRILMETVIVCAIFETSAIEFCDILIDDFISEGWNVDIAMAALAALSALYGIEAVVAETKSKVLSQETTERLRTMLVKVMQGEVNRHAVSRDTKWTALNPVNDEQDSSHYYEMMEELREPIDQFFENVGFEDRMGLAVATAKAAGRMVAASTTEENGYMPGPVGQMIVLRGVQAVLSKDTA